MSKFQIDLTKYPALHLMAEQDKEGFIKTLSSVITHIDRALADDRDMKAREYYKMSYTDMINDIMDVFFDFEGIVQEHHNNAEKEGLRALHEDIHPLAIFTNNAPVYDAQGNNISPQKWIEQDKFDLKNWLLALFYGARFVSWKELAEYLSLGEYELMDVLKARNFNELAKIQPALQYQEDQGIPVGKLIAGTGFFDGGNETSKPLESCPACASDWNTKHEKYAFCSECRLGGKK